MKWLCYLDGGTMETIKHCQIFYNIFWGYIIKQNVIAMHFEKINHKYQGSKDKIK